MTGMSLRVSGRVYTHVSFVPQNIYQGSMADISMPATEHNMVSTQARSVNLFPCTKYRHPKQLPTNRVIADYNVSPAFRMTTTTMLLQHGEKRVYTGPAKRAIIDATVCVRVCVCACVLVCVYARACTCACGLSICKFFCLSVHLFVPHFHEYFAFIRTRGRERLCLCD